MLKLAFDLVQFLFSLMVGLCSHYIHYCCFVYIFCVFWRLHLQLSTCLFWLYVFFNDGRNSVDIIFICCAFVHILCFWCLNLQLLHVCFSCILANQSFVNPVKFSMSLSKWSYMEFSFLFYSTF